MTDRKHTDRVMQVPSLQDYFRTCVEEVVTRQRVDIDPHASHYVVNMLTMFSRADELYEDDGEHYGLRPLALMLADAASADTQDRRTALLRRIGDVALFVSGFFADGLARSVVDVDYYIRMGGNAYGSLSEEVRGTFHGRAFAPVYRELACKFGILVDVLNEICDGPADGSDVDLVRTYQLWRKTGSRRAEGLLRRYAIVPLPTPGFRRH